MKSLLIVAILVVSLTDASACIQVSCAGRMRECQRVCSELTFFPGQTNRALCFGSREDPARLR